LPQVLLAGARVVSGGLLGCCLRRRPAEQLHVSSSGMT
jgi:hypothetical protein